MNATPTPFSPELERLARRNVGMRMGWLIHATVFVLVNVGLLVHGAVVGLRPTGEAIRNRMLDKERQRLQNR